MKKLKKRLIVILFGVCLLFTTVFFYELALLQTIPLVNPEIAAKVGSFQSVCGFALSVLVSLDILLFSFLLSPPE